MTYRAETEDWESEAASAAVRRVMGLPREAVADLAWERSAGDPVVVFAASLGVDAQTGERVFTDRWAAAAVLGTGWSG
ncbi:hypothetical protein [Streptomyces sp. NPDC018045]|uniref:hypothetical protein n=1 Tax=Streptomyces sp. NPDC018045 TaxID=3365037 RepID=UPI00378BF9F9